MVDDIAPLAGARLRQPAARVERRFWLILAGSMAFHAALFGLLSGQRKAMPPLLPTIVASLRLVSITESGASAPAQSVAAPLPTKVRPMPAPAVARAAPPVLATAGPASAPDIAPASPAASFAASESSPAALPAVSTPAAPGPETAQPVTRPQSEVLDGYRRRLGELLARHQEYPRIAALRGWEGEVRLRLKVARRGNLLGVQLDRSSGYAVLDQHALAMLEALAGLPPLPDALEGNEIQVVVPIHYKLKKTT